MIKSKLAIVLGLALTLFVFSIGCSNSNNTTDTKDTKNMNDTKETLSPKDKALKSFTAVLKSHSDKINYHKVLKHWNIAMPTGELFEWSKNVGENKADYAMVLYAEPFIKAGLDTSKLKDDNWLFKAAEVYEGKNLPDRIIHPLNIDDKAENSNGWEDALRRIFNKEPIIISYNDSLKTTTLALANGFVVELKENDIVKNSEFKFKINSTALVNAGLDITKLDNSEWIKEGNDQLVRTYKMQ